jgi:hypothetical protein
LNRHLRVLEEGNMVGIVKNQDRNRSLAVCRITVSGGARYIEYLATLEKVVRDAAEGAKESPASSTPHSLTPSRA